MKPSDPLHASYEKVKRAKSKLSKLKTTIVRFEMNAIGKTRIERHADRFYAIARINKKAPRGAAFEAVEIVGHLRGALDKMVIDMVETNGFGLSGVQFPFDGYDRNFVGQTQVFPSRRLTGRDDLKKKLTSDQWNFIMATEPYPTGNETLWALNEIANADKHRKGLVTVRAATTGIHNMLNSAFGGEGFIDYFANEPLDCDFVLSDKERETVLYVVGTNTFNLHVESKVTAGVVFGELIPVTGKDIVVTLGQQVKLVNSILDAAKAAFF